MPFLKMLRGPQPGLEVELTEDAILIGRGRKNDIIIQDNEVSREHSRMVRVLDDYEIHDLNSTNGTFVNGQRLDASGWLLSNGAIVEMGDSITFEYVASDLATSPPDLESSEKAELPPTYLVVKQRSRPKPELYRLDRMTIAVGREIDNDVVLQEPEVSRHHLRIVLTEDGHTIEDLNTLNGTYVNDRRLVTRRLLLPSDVIRIGKALQVWFTTDPQRLLDQLEAGEAVDQNEYNEHFQTRPLRRDDLRQTAQLRAPEDLIMMELDALRDHVFIAHAREEWPAVVRDLYDFLEKKGVKVWSDIDLDPENDYWTEAIEQAQAEARCLLAVISPPALRAPHVQRSIRFFLAREKPILLMQYGNIKRLPMMVNNIPVVRYDAENPTRAFQQLLAELQKLGPNTP